MPETAEPVTSDRPSRRNCLLCGHRVWKHNFYEAGDDDVPCPDCPDGRCRFVKPMITRYQERGIAELLSRLGRPVPDGGIAHLTFIEAGDLLMELHGELFAKEEQ